MMTTYSLIVDFVANKIAKRYEQKGLKHMRYLPILVATSWPMFVIHTRPFSNGLEAAVFAIVLVGMMDTMTSGSGSGNNSSGSGKDKAREGLREDAMLINFVDCMAGREISQAQANFLPLTITSFMKRLVRLKQVNNNCDLRLATFSKSVRRKKQR